MGCCQTHGVSNEDNSHRPLQYKSLTIPSHPKAIEADTMLAISNSHTVVKAKPSFLDDNIVLPEWNRIVTMYATTTFSVDDWAQNALLSLVQLCEFGSSGLCVSTILEYAFMDSEAASYAYASPPKFLPSFQDRFAVVSIEVTSDSTHYEPFLGLFRCNEDKQVVAVLDQLIQSHFKISRKVGKVIHLRSGDSVPTNVPDTQSVKATGLHDNDVLRVQWQGEEKDVHLVTFVTEPGKMLPSKMYLDCVSVGPFREHLTAPYSTIGRDTRHVRVQDLYGSCSLSQSKKRQDVFELKRSVICPQVWGPTKGHAKAHFEGEEVLYVVSTKGKSAMISNPLRSTSFANVKQAITTLRKRIAAALEVSPLQCAVHLRAGSECVQLKTTEQIFAPDVENIVDVVVLPYEVKFDEIVCEDPTIRFHKKL
eukprot:PhF_6_TR37627/c0_g1_i2/m.55960